MLDWGKCRSCSCDHGDMDPMQLWDVKSGLFPVTTVVLVWLLLDPH